MNIIEQVEEYVKQKIEEYKNTSEDHYDFWNEHIKYVYNESLDLADKYNADKEIVALGSLLHDIALINKVGDRSKSVGDDVKGIFFFDGLSSTNEWIEMLYENANAEELELLRFNLKDRKWIMHNGEDFYLAEGIPANKIEYVRVFDTKNRFYTTIDNLDYDYVSQYLLIWRDLEDYKVFKEDKKRALALKKEKYEQY